MKTIKILLPLGLLVAWQSTGNAQTNNNISADTVTKPQVQHTFPILESATSRQLNAQKDQESISRYHNLSSQPWMVMANRQPDESLFQSCGVTEADFPVVTVRW